MAECGNCSACSGCGLTLELTQGELELLQQLSQFAFLPVARRADDMTPIYLEADTYSQEEYSLLLQLLERKNLISLDYDGPLKGVDMGKYAGYPVHGSMALTQRGQQVVEQLELQGIC